MGNGALLPLKWSFQDDIDLTLISKMMPAYYVQDNVPTPTEIADAIAQWNMVYNEEVKSGNSKRRNDFQPKCKLDIFLNLTTQRSQTLDAN